MKSYITKRIKNENIGIRVEIFVVDRNNGEN